MDATRRHLDAKGDPEQRRGRVNATNENSKKPTGNDQMTIGLVSDLYVSLGLQLSASAGPNPSR